jgi:Glyoxalase-like domain
MRALDHLVVAAPDLDAGVAAIERRLGVRPSPGGRHAAWGTRNALLAIGGDAFLEVIGPDPGAPAPPDPRPFGIDRLAAPRLVTWCARSISLEADVARAAAAGVDLGAMLDGRRMRDDGVELRWRLTDLRAPRLDGLVPFLIDWGTTPHPSATAAGGARLLTLRAEHPDPGVVERALRALGSDVPVTKANRPALIAKLATPRGEVELS